MTPLINLKLQIEALGLTVLESTDAFIVLKPIGLVGNKINKWKSHPFFYTQSGTDNKTEYISDCPTVDIFFSDGQFGMSETFKIMQWEWTPGPGPGDFVKGFNTVEETVEFIRSYFFEDNDLFNQRKKYEEERHQK